MAKAKKSKLTIEDALVPVGKQPYKVPGNWCWVLLSSVATWGSGGTPLRKVSDYYDGDIPWVKTGELDDDYIYDSEEKITDNALANSSAKLFPEGSVLIAMYGATIGKTAILGIPAATNQACACAQCNNSLYNKFLFYYLQSQKGSFIAKGKGGAQPNISQDIIKCHPIPLPPLAEQQRIVDQIESLFSKLDKAKERAQEVLYSIENRRRMIIHKAFEGAYSENWRKENGFRLEDWEELTLNDVAEYKKGPFGSSITKAMFVPKSDNTYKVYEQGNAIRKTLNYGKYYINEQKYNELKIFSVKAGDIIISCAGTIGEVYKLPEECEAGVINQALMRVRLYDNIDERFFMYYFGEILKGDVNEEANGTAIKNIPPFKIMKAMKINLPSIDEQHVIADMLDVMLEKEDKIKEDVINVMNQIDLIKISILAKAFRGELGTNNPDDESSLELLKQILEQ